MKKIILLCLSLILCVTFSACGKEAEQPQQQAVVPATAVFETSMGNFKCRLDTKNAPLTTKNFIDLSKKGFYNGLTFHRVIPGFMIQGGCPLGTGTGGPGWNIKGEFAANGVNNPLKHTRGVISMARSMNPNSAGSQFFIMHQDAPHLDGQYAAFGKVVAGMDVVDKIASVRTDWNDKPTTPVKMKTVELIEG